jgi:hypothetical protein
VGVLSHLVVAPESDAQRVLGNIDLALSPAGIDIKGIDSLKFAVLHGILRECPYSELLELYVPIGEDDGPWVFRIPEDLVVRVAALTDTERGRVARHWARSDELALAGWDRADVARVLDSIARLARKARTAKAALFLRMSL